VESGYLSRQPLATDPLLNDTDNDGYWDGWIGVHNVSYTHGRGVGHTDNVILYQHNLDTGNGIEGDEIVQEQIRIHEPPTMPDGAGADIDGDNTAEHSNLHVGERQWDTDPQTDTEAVNLSIETDFVEGPPNEQLNDAAWIRGIEQNYALYGINVSMTQDGIIDPVFESSPDFRSIPSADQYMAVTTESALDASATGYNGYAVSRTSGVPSIRGMYIYRDAIRNSDSYGRVTSYSVNRSPYDSRIQVMAAHVAMHEIGHSFAAGEKDDSEVVPLPRGEVYSGSLDNDDTLERVPGASEPFWSIMRAGWSGDAAFYHSVNGQQRLYYPFSIEEMMTVREP